MKNRGNNKERSKNIKFLILCLYKNLQSLNKYK